MCECSQRGWRTSGDGHGITLAITLEAIGVETVVGAANEAASAAASAKDATVTDSARAAHGGRCVRVPSS